MSIIILPRLNQERTPAAVVTGWLGCIGQSLVYTLKSHGQDVVIVDQQNLPSAVPGVPVFRGSIDDAAVWQGLFARYRPVVVYHCAALISVSESMAQPAK